MLPFKGLQLFFKRTFDLLLWRAKKKYFPSIELWLEHSL
jgi:hypothetical protein